MRWGSRGLGIAIACGVAVLLGGAPAASAATTIHVKSTQDISSGFGDKGDCLTADHTCSLRQALASAQNGDTVSLPAGEYDLTQPFILIIQTNITLTGAGARTTTIKQLENGYNGLNIGSGVTATVQGVRITGGHTAADFGGGGIASFGPLTLKNSAVTGNEADGHADTSFNPPFYFAGQGGGISESGGPLTIVNSTISGNFAKPGAGAGAQGGGIYSINPVTIINSTIAGNTADGSGGALPAGAQGGGIVMGPDPNASLTMTNATVAFNTATGPSGRGGNIYQSGAAAPTAVANSIIADGTADSGTENCVDTLFSQGYNLEDRNQCGLNGTGDRVSTPAQLGALANHGGPEDTVSLLSGSPAINGGNPGGCRDPLSVVLGSDQRGVPRPQGARCDIGAFEFRAVTLVGRPRIAGRAQVGRTLSCLLPAVHSPDGPAAKAVRWLRGLAADGSGAVHKVLAADAGQSLRCRLVVANSAGSATATSSAVFVPPVPTVTITSHSVSSGHHRATFTFVTRHATGSRCALAKGSGRPSYSPCSSPKTYRGLVKGRYTFSVRAIGPGGTSAPAQHAFRIS